MATPTSSDTPAAPDDRFYDRADEHIELSNQQINATETRGKVSASMMYANARFSAWICASGFSSQKDMAAAREERIAFFCEQYRKMLNEHYDDYVENFDDYMKTESTQT